MFSVRAKNLK